MQNEEYEISKELRSLNGERALGNKMLDGQRNQMAEMLRGGMGRDMMDVLSGKKKVKLPWKQRFKRKMDFFREILFGKESAMDDEPFMTNYYEEGEND